MWQDMGSENETFDAPSIVPTNRPFVRLTYINLSRDKWHQSSRTSLLVIASLSEIAPQAG